MFINDITCPVTPDNVTASYFVTLSVVYYIIGKFRSYIIGTYFVTLSGDFATLSVVTLSANLELHNRVMLHYKVFQLVKLSGVTWPCFINYIQALRLNENLNKLTL